MKPIWITTFAAIFTAATLVSEAQSTGPGSALLFNGTNGYATVTNASVFNFGGAFTVEAWIKVASFTTNWQAIVTKGDSAWRLHRYMGTQVVSFGTSGFYSAYDAEPDEDLPGVTPVNDGYWHHVAGVYDGEGTKYLYVDGALEATASVFGALGNNSFPLDIGENAQQTSRVWDGEIDEVRLWNVARSQSQILGGMHRSLTGSESGLVAYYRLDEGLGTNITNSVLEGGAEDGVLSGAAAWAVSTAPIGPPVASIAAATQVGSTLATLNGSLMFNYQDTAYCFQYGTSTNYGTAIPFSFVYAADADANNAPFPVSQGIQGLSLGTTYHFHLVASNSAGIGVSADQVFTTGSLAVATIYSLGNGTGGNGPYGGLILSGNAFYGTAESGGDFSDGAVFKINVDGTGYTNLYSFADTSDGAYPSSGLVMSGNTLYGVAEYGGESDYGTVFRVNTDGTGFSNLFIFSYTNGSGPRGSLVLSGSTLYGTTQDGGAGGFDSGTVFKINVDGTGFAALYSFTNGTDGANPRAGLLLAGDILYGTADSGGNSGYGSVFAIHTDGSGFTNLYTFTVPSLSTVPYTNSDGDYPEAGLILANGKLYGMASGGGSTGNGTVFAVNTDGTGFTNLHNFTGGDGANPDSSLVLAGNTLYGVTPEGGSFGDGNIFALNTNGTGFTNFYSFTGGDDGGFPEGGLIVSGNTLYGATSSGGTNFGGTVFALTLDSAPTPIPLNIQAGNQAVILSWTNQVFSLQSAPVANGNFANVPGAASPYTNPITSTAMFFRLKAN